VRNAGEHGILLFAVVGFDHGSHDSLADRTPTIGHRSNPRATKVGARIDFGRVFSRAHPAYAGRHDSPPSSPQQAHRAGGGRAATARRSRRDWIVDSALFLLAAVFGTVAGLSSARHGLHGPLLVVDAVGGAGLCLAMWWRRRWPLSLGLVSLPVLAVSYSAGPAGVIILYTVAAYRRWQLAALVAAGQVALLPVGRILHPQGNSLAAYYLASMLGTAVIVAWGMFRQGRRQSRWERARHSETSSSCASSRSGTRSARGSRGRCTTSSRIGSRC